MGSSRHPANRQDVLPNLCRVLTLPVTVIFDMPQHLRETEDRFMLQSAMIQIAGPHSRGGLVSSPFAARRYLYASVSDLILFVAIVLEHQVQEGPEDSLLDLR